jgi:hypothetical protein
MTEARKMKAISLWQPWASLLSGRSLMGGLVPSELWIGLTWAGPAAPIELLAEVPIEPGRRQVVFDAFVVPESGIEPTSKSLACEHGPTWES